jgi:hypothetical protein
LTASGYGGPVLRVIESAGLETNLLRNASFEQREGAQFVAWTSAPQGLRVALGEGRAGSVALACEAVDDKGWYGASQTITLSRTGVAPIVVRGWSRAENVGGGVDSGYSLYVDLLYRDGTPLWGRTGNFRVGTHDWEQRELVILPEKPVQSVSVHCLFRGHTGKVWFDDVQLIEVTAPSGAVLFQGSPMALEPLEGSPSGTPSLFETQDGLKLRLTGGVVTGLEIEGRELAAKAPSGFLVRDIAANSDLFTFTGGFCPELDLRLETVVTSKADHLAFEGQITDLTGNDRAVLVAFALPIDARGWRWSDDMRRTRLIEGVGEFANTVVVNSGTTGMQSVYPLGCVHDDRSGIALALDMAWPAQYRLVYHAGTRQFLIAYDFGLAKEATRFPSGARFRFVLYRFDQRWGFRAAFQKLTAVFPEYFVVRSRDQGIWMPFTDVSRVEGWRDFGFRYHEGNNNVRFDDEHAILSFRYTEPMTWWMPMSPELPRDEATALKVRDEIANGPPGTNQRMAEVSRTAGMLDADGHPALLFRNEPWANGAVWSLNPNPFLPANPNGATVYWNESIREQLYGAGANGVLDGEYLDSLEGYVTADLNFRREHFRYTTVPLTFASDTRRPALAKGPAVFEFTRWISDEVHRLGKLCFANGVPYRFAFLCPWLDVMGTETDWLSNGSYQPASHAQMALWRAMACRKPYLLLMNTDYDRFGPDLVERYFQRSLFYGMFPSMFSHNAAENPYWLNPKWYNRDRPLFQRYIPLIKLVAEAGWQPVTEAVCDNSKVMVERFGPTSDGTVFYTLFNDSTAKQTVTLRETGRAGGSSSSRTAVELLSNKALRSDGAGWPVEIAAQGVAVIRVRPATRFTRVVIDGGGSLFLEAEAPTGTTQVLEVSPDFATWTPLLTNVISSSPCAWLDRGITGKVQRFYRLRG